MQEQEVLEYLDIPFSFHERPTPLQPQLRVIWGLSALVLILKIASRAKSSSVSRLHLLNWAIRNSENRERVVELIERKSSLFATLVQYNPGFNRAIEYALAEGLIEMKTKNAKIFLTHSGENVAGEIISLENCFEEEKKFLKKKGSLITEDLAKKIFKANL